MPQFSTYTPKTWQSQEILKTTDLNHIEQGIALNNDLIEDLIQHGVTNLPEEQMTQVLAYIDSLIQNLDLTNTITIDTQLSENSTNPVQNKVIYSALESKFPHIINHKIIFSGLNIDGNTEYPEQSYTNATGVSF